MDIDPSFWDSRVLGRTSSVQPSFPHGGDGSLGLLVRENEDSPEIIEMQSMRMVNPYGHSDNGYGKHFLR